MVDGSKLLDLYEMTALEAKVYWKAEGYTKVLRDKIERSKKLQEKLMDEPMKTRDMNRIKRIGDNIAHLNCLLGEVNW